MKKPAATAPETLRIQHRRLDGVHIFTSVDFPGLHVAHKDLGKAYEALPRVISDLVRLKSGNVACYELDKTLTALRTAITAKRLLPEVIAHKVVAEARQRAMA